MASHESQIVTVSCPIGTGVCNGCQKDFTPGSAIEYAVCNGKLKSLHAICNPFGYTVSVPQTSDLGKCSGCQEDFTSVSEIEYVVCNSKLKLLHNTCNPFK
jgi:hypothetical protein